MFFPISPTEGSLLPPETSVKTTWVFLLLLLLLLLLCLVSCVTLKWKSRAIKNKLEWAGEYPQCIAHTNHKQDEAFELQNLKIRAEWSGF